MKDGAISRCIAGGLIVSMYGIYMVSSVMSGHDPVNGILFGTILAALVFLATGKKLPEGILKDKE